MDLDSVTLCSFCSALVGETKHLDAAVPHHPTYGALESSGASCALCQTIASLWRFEESHLTRYAKTDNEFALRKETWALHITTLASERMPSGVQWSLMEAGFSNPNTHLLIRSTFTIVACKQGGPLSLRHTWETKTTKYSQKISAIRTWLQQCRLNSTEGHEHCRPDPFTPLRLIHVGVDGSPLRLVEPESREGQTEYATLSYCWGKELPLRTLKETRAGLLKEIPEGRLPRTFADAIQMTRDLEIPYLWIDALCIIQDDEYDWQDQAAEMDKIYQGSQLTISAVESNDCNQGCFLEDSSGWREGEMLFKAPQVTTDGSNLLVRIYQDDIRHRSSIDTPLSCRGWTFQEQLLSSRIVSCMQPEVHWNCLGSYQTECGLQFNISTLDRLYRHSKGWIMPTRTTFRTAGSSGSVWGHIANNYSQRNFTYSGDRIVALMGIIRYLSTWWQDENILGLWKSKFAQGLAWLRLGQHADLDSEALARSLPSWSWLSCSEVVEFDFWNWDTTAKGEDNYHITLLDYAVCWTGSPYTSAVDFGSSYAQVEGYMKEIEITPCARGSVSNPPFFRIQGETLDFENDPRPWRCMGNFDSGTMSESATYPCLLLRSWQVDENGSTHEIFLILEGVGKPQDARYRRVGLARILGGQPIFDTSKKVCIYLV